MLVTRESESMIHTFYARSSVRRRLWDVLIYDMQSNEVKFL